MSTNENLTPAAELSTDQAITIQPSGVATYGGAGDWMAPAEGDDAQSTLSPMALLHALRRHWLVMLATGVAAAAVAATVVALVQKPKYEATATLLIAPAVPRVLHSAGSDDSEVVPNEFEIFRETQKLLLKQRFVLTAALRNPRLKNLASIQREDARHNALTWLLSEVQVDVKKDSGIMIVSVTLPDPAEAASIVNAVVEAYKDEVVNKDRLQRRERLDSLQKISGEKEAEVRSRRETLKRELDAVGVPDDQSAVARQNMVVTMYMEYQRELQGMRRERTALSGKLEEYVKMRDSVAGAEIPEMEVASLLNGEPDYRDQAPRLQALQNFIKQQDLAVGPGYKRPASYTRAKAELDATEKNVEDMKFQAREKVRGAKRIDLEQKIHEMTTELNIATEQVNEFQKQVDSKEREADAVGKSSVAAQMARADVENVERILHGVAEERERLRVELNSPLRIKILGDENAPAAVPDAETGVMFRYLFIVAAALTGLTLPGVGIIAWDLRKQRINSPEEVSKNLKLSVMGTLPFIPATIMRRLGSASRKSQVWKLRYTEAVDGVVARLLRNAECDQCRVNLVTSAMGGEGKTWLATQLAMGLARAQRRTVLVDFDLRQPALDSALGLPLGPGVCEALRGQGDITQMVQPTETEYLSVVTAGSWNRQVLPALANGSVATVLEQLRENYDFVILDSSPLLPIVDTRLVCQHVDAVLLSVLRDISEGGKVLAAQKMLDAFGVATVHAVVTGGEPFGSAKNLLHHAAMADDAQAQLAEEPLDGDAPGEDGTQNH